MKNIIMTSIVITVVMLATSCQTTNPITNEYLTGKKFVEDNFIGVMGVNYLTFIDNEKIHYVIHDKRDFGYNGTYTIKNIDGKQYIKISNIEKFGFQFDALKGYDKDYVMIEVKSPTKLKVLHSGKIFKYFEKKEK